MSAVGPCRPRGCVYGPCRLRGLVSRVARGAVSVFHVMPHRPRGCVGRGAVYVGHGAVGPCWPWGRVGRGAVLVVGPCWLWGRVDRGAVLAEGLCLWAMSAEGPCRLRSLVGRVARGAVSGKGLCLLAVLSNIYMVISTAVDHMILPFCCPICLDEVHENYNSTPFASYFKRLYDFP